MGRIALVMVIATVVAASDAQAGRINGACLKSDRSNVNPALCACLQRVADQILTRSDQRLAARFFEEPQLAQDTRMSDTPADDAFWDRYTDFGTTAANVCSSFAG